MLKNMIALAVAAFASTSAFGAEPISQEVDELQALVPEVQHWNKIASGLFEADADGVRTKVYLGEAGRALYLSTLRDELVGARAQALSKDAEKAEQAVAKIASIEHQLTHLSKPSVGAETKATTSALPITIGTCGGNYHLSSSFTAFPQMVDLPTANASSSWGLDFGPPAGEITVFRAAVAEVEGVLEYDHTFELIERLDASAKTLTFGGSCGMRTRHITNVRCYGYGATSIVDKSTTCADVLDGKPPL